MVLFLSSELPRPINLEQYVSSRNLGYSETDFAKCNQMLQQASINSD